MRILSVVALLVMILIPSEHDLIASEKCAINVNFDANLEHLLEWCSSHGKNDDECNEFLDLASQLPTKEFFKKLKGLEAKNNSASLSVEPPKPNHTWTDIPKSPIKAFQKLDELIKTPLNGLNNQITLNAKTQKYFETLNSAEIKHAFEIIEKMKSSPNQFELDKFLTSKNLELLIGSQRKHCSGTDVYSVRLSAGSRMCFQFSSKNPLSIKILCMGQGNHCYNH